MLRYFSTALAGIGSIVIGGNTLYILENGTTSAKAFAIFSCLMILIALFFNFRAWYFFGKATAYKEMVEDIQRGTDAH